MTRNFSDRRRDDMRPTPRNTSSGRYREEQSSRSTRPRLSRDTVDRAWENGATRKYADYRSRPNTSMPQNQRQGRPSPRFERSRPSYEPRNYERRAGEQRPYEHSRPSYEPRSYDRREGEQRPYEHRQEGYRAPSSFQRGEPQRERHSEEGPHHFNEPGHRAPGGQPRLNSERWTRNTPPRRESERGGYRERYEDERPPRFTRSNRDSFGRNDQRAQSPRERSFEQSGPRRMDDRTRPGPRNFERPDRERENFAHGKRTSGPRPRRDVYNPRWQSRPAAQRDYREYESSHERPAAQRDYRGHESSHERPAFQQTRGASRPEGAQFEGDYEHFATDVEAEQPEQGYEPHVTRLPDGRVLKGSRPAQRRAARFWTDVEDETQTLLTHSPAPQEQEELTPPPAVQETPAPRSTRPARPRKQPDDQARKVKTVKTTHASEQKPRETKAGKKKAPARKTVIYPSQRGYKWPASGE